MRIDWWTLALQTVNVLILVWILGRFFFRPVAGIVARRREEIDKLLADAAAARQDAATLKTEAEAARSAIDAERDRLMAEARQEAQAEKAGLLAQSADDIARRRSEAQSMIARDRATAARAILDHASDLSVQIARRLLLRLPADASSAAFLEGLCGELRALSPDLRQALASADPDHPVTMVSAVPLTEDQANLVRETLRAAIGVEPPLSFHTDQDLIAGFEIHARNTVLHNDWRSDLARIREELDHDRLLGRS
ncbi:hypothetical protein FFK22_025655 [Mycobacterium sp. KBS0706]|jgi:F-type H+-transporting ATPase subunit b|uniref:F0F1 ATP synthase subunit delta n=1 Tax=Mycobacterium sp. KBS0706 TaxID=2578109 RepID=UPI00110FAA73|nr:F0F1 ATP synthase subunit delta [Mycobacterium sp. KBS0706]TSD85757.1 hypothetical protein FFK22_025655 [Mycobacterium sp. KBS0706]